MLVGFSVGNYKSFKNRQSISFEASKIVRHKNHVSIESNKRLLKSALIFGANASGKSNFIEAIDISRLMIIGGLDRINLNKCHFRISKEMYNQPAIFEYRMIIDEVEYSYGIVISYVNKSIISEWLVRFEKNGKETYIFNREVDSNNVCKSITELKFTNDKQKERMDFFLEGFSENISDSYKRKTILSDIALRVNDDDGIFFEIKKVFEWFDKIIVIFPETKYNYSDVATDEIKKIHLSEWMKHFDTGIEKVIFEKQHMDFEKIFHNDPSIEAIRKKIDISNAVEKRPVVIKINGQIYEFKKDENGNIIYDKLVLNHGNEEDLFDYDDESDGTKRLIDLVPVFYEKDSASVVLIDEIDRSIHTKAVREFLEIFYESNESENHQLIATTHDTNLLDLDLLRQDEIWFVERQEDNSSKVYSLNKYKQRFDKKIDKDYLLGRYGAVPVFLKDNILEE
ncbi:hypothetical protein SAMN02745111_01087 [Eubacterium uniforme]|uniref:ATPase AAA-type core domain-containing protein n=1 Tax=Eubacterium uniforme TaxID=39495 RepID=A0A1T4VKA5_9FIRM|nr:ATP-binding protein [Eubacterium uniforme]SKA65392.1 hypothetical protein SAMN02745111_01087 [Eubacterium uniforme]